MAYAISKLSEAIVRAEDAMAVIVTSLDHARVHRGEIWRMATSVPSKNDGQSYVLHFKTAASVAEVHATLAVAGSGAGLVRIYEGPTVSAGTPALGTAVTMVNANRITANQRALASALYHTPTTTDNGTILGEWYFGSGNKGAGETDQREHEYVLKPDTSYLIVLESDAAGNIMSYNFAVYEKS
jgi:hypothetical protein